MISAVLRSEAAAMGCARFKAIEAAKKIGQRMNSSTYTQSQMTGGAG